MEYNFEKLLDLLRDNNSIKNVDFEKNNLSNQQYLKIKEVIKPKDNIINVNRDENNTKLYVDLGK